MTPDEVGDVVARATGECPQGVTLLKGVGNNVVAKMVTRAGPRVAKIYFRHPEDPRDRLGTEHSVLSFLWESGVTRIPRPYGMYRQESLGIFEFVDGDPLGTGDITWADVEQLVTFLGDLYHQKDRPGARELPMASEFAPSLSDYRENVTRRFRRLQREINPQTDPAAADFVNGPLLQAHEELNQFLESQLKAGGNLDDVLDPSQRTLSPADHGFQNALRRNGQLVFLDFEYAGWDDPAQVIANACLHPAVPMPPALVPRFVRELSERLGGGSALRQRLRCVFPLLAFKWGLIMLNEFIPMDRDRRAFTGAIVELKKGNQLEKSIRQLDKVKEALADHFFLEEMLHGTN